MTGSNQPRFRLLIGWCCLMSAAILIMIVFLGITKKQLNTSSDKETNNPSREKQIGLTPGQSINYIRLIRGEHHSQPGDQKYWICSPSCENSSLSLESGALKMNVSGLYYINAQVSHSKSKANQIKHEGKDIVTLLRNEGNGKSRKKLSEVRSGEEGHVTINRMVYLQKGDSISLKIPESMILLKNEWETYWEIFLL